MKFKFDLILKDMYLACNEVCLQACESIKYSVSSYSRIRSDSPNTIILRIYYNHLQRTVIQQEPKISPSDLFSNIGGALGLLVGASLMSIIEIIELIPIITIKACKKMSKVKPKKDSKTNSA